MRLLLQNLLRTVAVAAVLSSCGRAGLKPPLSGDLDIDVLERTPQDYKGARAPSYAWEVWPLHTDLVGIPVKNFYILKGDSELYAGKRKSALFNYQKARLTGYERDLEAALTMRIASTELALDQAGRAVAEIEDYMRRRKPNELDSRFALILAYAYGRSGSINNSISYFSRVYSGSGRSTAAGEISARGLAQLLSVLSESELAEVEEAWKDDLFVSNAVRREKERRVLQQDLIPEETDNAPFWEHGPASRSRVVESIRLDKTVVGLMLPLSGRYGSLGRSTRNGIELALGGGEGAGFKLKVRDTSGRIDYALAGFNDLTAVDKPSLILGPFLSDLSEMVIPQARRANLPLITLAKREDLDLGGGIFRLGTTIRSQVVSLVEASFDTLGIRRYGIVFPADQSGEKFASEFKDELLKRGLAPVYEASYFKNDSDSLTFLAGELERQRIEALFLPDRIERAAQFLSNLSRYYRSRIRVLGPASWDDAAKLSHSKTVLEGSVFVSPFYYRSDSPLVSRFIEAYRSRYKKTPDFLAAQGYDIGTMIRAAVKHVKQQGGSFADSFQSIKTYRGLTGIMTVGANGEVRRQFVVVQLKSGRIAPLERAAQILGGR